jgi:hypothetical protein
MPVGHTANHFQGVLESFCGMSAPKQDTQLFDDGIRELGKVREGAFFNLFRTLHGCRIEGY